MNKYKKPRDLTYSMFLCPWCLSDKRVQQTWLDVVGEVYVCPRHGHVLS